MNQKSDEQLVEEIKNGDIGAYEDLVRRYQMKVLRYTKRILGSEAEASETTQDTFLAVYKNINKIDTQRKFSTYVFVAAKNMAISRWRKNSAYSTEQLTEEVSENKDEGLRLVEEGEKNAGVHKALSKLKSDHAKAIRLYYFDDLSYAEVAAKMAIPVNTVRTYLRRAKQELKAEITRI